MRLMGKALLSGESLTTMNVIQAFIPEKNGSLPKRGAFACRTTSQKSNQGDNDPETGPLSIVWR